MTWRPGPVWMFCPADRPERYAKAAAAADVVILDLEDAVAPHQKAAARAALADAELDLERTVIRINATGSAEHEADLAVLDAIGCPRLMLAKTESSSQLSALAPRSVIVLIETPLGLRDVDRLTAEPNVIAAMWGAEDLVSGLGGTSSRTAAGSYREVARYARSRTLVAAKSSGRMAIDAVYTDIADLDGLRAESEDAVASGFDVKVAIHPTQVATIRAAFRPSPEAAEWAERLLATAAGQRGVFAFEGAMVDGPILRQAERIRQLSS